MTTWVLKSVKDVTELTGALTHRKFPLTVNVTAGKKRSIEQNKLQRRWLNEAAEQLGDETAEDKRGYCKLHLAVPILRNENEEFRAAYDRVIRPLRYELKLEAMKVPLDFPVTRLMTTKQKKQYLDAMYQHFRSLGVMLTEPDQDNW